MTILMGTYSNDAHDVALIADRRQTPRNADNVASIEDAVKTLRLGSECAIGFSGAVPLHNAILSQLLSVPQPPQEVDLLGMLVYEEDNLELLFDDVVDALNDIVPGLIAFYDPPPEVGVSVLLAGRFERERPILAGMPSEDGWKLEPLFSSVYSAPFGKDDRVTRQAFEASIHTPGADYVERMEAAIRFCAERYESVNRFYVLRRLSEGFRREEGSVQLTSTS